MQLYFIVERSIDAYKVKLSQNYSVIAVSKEELSSEAFAKINKIVSQAKEIAPDSVIKRLSSDMKSTNVELLKLTLPRFYKLSLSHYPSPEEIKIGRAHV